LPAQVPLPLDQLDSLDAGTRPGELLVRSVPGQRALLRGLRDRQALSERVDELLRTYRAEASLSSLSPRRRHRRPSLGDQLVHTREETSKRDLAATMLQTLQRGRTARQLVERQHGRWRQLLMSQRVVAAADMFVRPPHALWFVGTASPRRDCPALVEAVLRGEKQSVLTLLGQRADPDSFDARGIGALHVACAQSRLWPLHVLLEAGADVELVTRDRWKQRALHVASFSTLGVGHAGVTHLLGAGADPTATRCDGRTAASLAPRSRTQKELRAAETSWAATDERKLPRAALVHAVAAGRTERVLALLKHGTDPDSIDEHGTGAVHMAAIGGNAVLLQALLQAGAAVNRAARDKLAARPLHCAARAGDVKCVQLLLRAAANPLKRDAARRLPLERCQEGSAELRALLLRAMSQAQAGGAPGHRRTPSGGGRPAGTAMPVLHARVHARGPVRELRLWDSTREDEAPKQPARGGGGSEQEAPPWLVCMLQLEGVGLSLIDQEPREIVQLSLHSLALRLSRSAQQQSFELSLGHLQARADAARPRTCRAHAHAHAHAHAVHMHMHMHMHVHMPCTCRAHTMHAPPRTHHHARTMHHAGRLDAANQQVPRDARAAGCLLHGGRRGGRRGRRGDRGH
jgi:ankyrin repeat protein